MVQKSGTLLIIDNSSQMHQFDFLKPRYATHWAHDDTSVPDMMAASSPDAVLLNANRLNALKTIRTQDSEIPVILLTTHTNRHRLEQGLHMGADDYLLQPLDRRLALKRIQLQVETRRKLQAQRARIAELEAAQQEQAQLARIIRHDLQNPLLNLQMAAALLEEHPNDQTVLTSMQYSLQTMYEMIDEFAEAFAIKSALDLQLSSLSAEQLVLNVSQQYLIAATQKDITIDYGDLTGEIYADRKAMQRILANLFSNAVKYSPLGGTINVWTEITNAHLRIYISDQGAGIPAAERDRLFTEFGKLSTRPTAQESSTGLGLWIVKQLAEAQGGTVGADFPADGGSVFWVELPLHTAAMFIA